MTKSTISRVSNMVSQNIDISSFKRKETISEIDFAIDKIKVLLSDEITRQNITENELQLQSRTDLKEYLFQINKNIEKLQIFMNILNDKKREISFDIQSLISSSSCIELSKPITFFK